MANTFVVTSNADAGPGTLRQAIINASANSGVAQNYINFNIADRTEPGRTIVLLSSLPELSSNLTIDASTQPGQKIGISDAKIIITLNNTALPDGFRCFSGNNKSGIEIDGFYFKSMASASGNSTVIYFIKATDIVVGRSGKGNVFGMVDIPVNITLSKHFTLSGNFFGIDPKTSLPAVTPNSTNILISSTTDIKIGGDFYSDGNIFVRSQPGHESMVTDVDACSFKCNTIGYKTSGGGSGATINFNNIGRLGIYSNLYNYNSVTHISNVTVSASITSNRTNLDNKYQADPASTSATPFDLDNVKKTAFGGVGLHEGNTITNPGYANDYPALVTNNCSDVLVQRNIISCKSSGAPYISNASKVVLPVINITSVNNKIVSGKSTPLALIDIFSDSPCQQCEPNIYLGSTIASAAGNWAYTAPSELSGVTASATVGSKTSLFSKVGYDESAVVVKNPTCDNHNGSIKGIKALNSSKTEWTDQNGRLIGTSPDIENLAPGTYTFKAYMGKYCTSKSISYTLKYTKPIINAQALKVVNYTCPALAGSVTGLAYTNAVEIAIKSITWTNQAGQIAGTSLNLENAQPGKYTLRVINTDDCVTEYGPVTVGNKPALSVDKTQAVITPAVCDDGKGSITNISATGNGTLKFSWKNAQQQEVAITKDLLNQPSGAYTLQVLDETPCGPVYTAAIIIPVVNSITVDDAQRNVNIATCFVGKGAITNIKATGATAYKWLNADDQVVATTLDLTDALPGSYHLVAYNSTCSKTTPAYTILQQVNTTVYDYTNTLTDATCGFNNGIIKLTFSNMAVLNGTSVLNAIVSAKPYRWVNHNSGLTLAKTAEPVLTGLDAGTYDIYVTNDLGCERLLNSYTITRIANLVVKTNNVQIMPDNCGLKTGSIKGIEATSGKGPITFTWTNIAGSVIATTADLANLGAGTYRLKVSDGTGCEQGLVYIIDHHTTILPQPTVKDLQVCSAGEIILSVKNIQPEYTYRLYESDNSKTPLAEDKGGKFDVKVKTNRSYYISQYIGTCESPRAEMKVEVGISPVNLINAFSPNGDGINDTWTITGIETYPRANVQIYARSGGKVYESTGYAVPFNGNINGTALPTGIYYYIINLNAGCSLLSGSLTLIR
jgi:gliding motility-associated-like protein